MNDEKKLESEMLKILIESKKGLEKILEDSINIKNSSNEKNSFLEVTKEIESVLNKLEMLEFSEEE
jgi:Fe2+ transport system protein B